MKVAIITSVSGISSKTLAAALKFNGVEADVFKGHKHHGDFRGYDCVFSYGCSANTAHKSRLNSAAAVSACVDKMATFDILKAAKVPTVPYVLRKAEVPKEWEWVVVRDDPQGRKAEGMQIVQNYGALPDGRLFTEYFEHRYEYRIVVFRGEVVGRFFKNAKIEDGLHTFVNQPAKGFEEMDKGVLKAAKALGIDYCGFDVVCKNKKDYRILEANSGALLTDEAENAIVEYFINL